MEDLRAISERLLSYDWGTGPINLNLDTVIVRSPVTLATLRALWEEHGSYTKVANAAGLPKYVTREWLARGETYPVPPEKVSLRQLLELTRTSSSMDRIARKTGILNKRLWNVFKALVAIDLAMKYLVYGHRRPPS